MGTTAPGAVDRFRPDDHDDDATWNLKWLIRQYRRGNVEIRGTMIKKLLVQLEARPDLWLLLDGEEQGEPTPWIRPENERAALLQRLDAIFN